MHPCTFDSFVVSESSRVAFSAALALVEGRDRGALFLAGPTGSGKTHLLHAIAGGVRSRRPNARILQLAAADLAWKLWKAIHDDEAGAFRQSLEALDALLLDDLYLPRSLTLEEILRMAESLSRAGVIVAAAADTPARWPGPIVELGWPDEGARVEIARRTALTRGVTMSENELTHLARRGGNPRELQSAITRIAAEAAVARYA